MTSVLLLKRTQGVDGVLILVVASVRRPRRIKPAIVNALPGALPTSRKGETRRGKMSVMPQSMKEAQEALIGVRLGL